MDVGDIFDNCDNIVNHDLFGHNNGAMDFSHRPIPTPSLIIIGIAPRRPPCVAHFVGLHDQQKLEILSRLYCTKKQCSVTANQQRPEERKWPV